MTQRLRREPLGVKGSSGAGEAGQGGSAGGASTVVGRWGTAWANAADGRTPAECDAIADVVATDLMLAWSTLIVRFDYQSLKMLGYAFVRRSTNSGPVNENEARVKARSEVVFPLPSDPAGFGTLLPRSPGDPAWVFWQSPSDFGGSVAVSADTGATVFAGTTVWGGRGDILFPKEWGTNDIGTGCAPIQGLQPGMQGFDLTSGATLTEAGVARLVNESVLPSIWRIWGGGSGTPLVLLYPRTVGPSDPTATEYLVIVNGHTAGG